MGIGKRSYFAGILLRCLKSFVAWHNIPRHSAYSHKTASTPSVPLLIGLGNKGLSKNQGKNLPKQWISFGAFEG
jgi:hypothetical protein